MVNPATGGGLQPPNPPQPSGRANHQAWSNERRNALYLKIGMTATIILLALIGLVLWINQVNLGPTDNMGRVILALCGLYTIASFRVVGPQELGAVLLFGKPLYEVSPGLVFVPFGICQLVKESALVIEAEFPADPEKIDKSGDDTRRDPNLVQPIRVPTASPQSVDAAHQNQLARYEHDSLNHRMVTEVRFYTRYQIYRGWFIQFLQTIGSLEEANRQLRDTSEGILKVEFSKRTPPMIVAEQAEINDAMLEAAEILVGEKPRPGITFDPNARWALNIRDMRITDIDFSKSVHESLRNVPVAAATKQKTIIDAEAALEKKRREAVGENVFETEKGAGLASARQAYLAAEAVGLEAIAKSARTKAGKEALRYKTTEAAIKDNTKVVITPPGGIGNILGAAAAVQETLREEKKPAVPPSQGQP